MLYRLDFLNDAGTAGEAVRGWRGDFLSRHMSTARAQAVETAAATGRAILVTRIGKAGALKPTLVIHPDGRASKPRGAGGDDCTAGQGRGACFCANCRAVRRAR